MRTSTVALGLTIALLGAGLAGVPGALADTAICGDAGSPPRACDQAQPPETIGDACERDEDGDGIPDSLDDDNNEIPDTSDDDLPQLDRNAWNGSWTAAQASDLCQAHMDCLMGLAGEDRSIDKNPASTADQIDTDGDGIGDACDPGEHVRDCGAALAEGAACHALAPVSVGGEQYADAR